MLAECLYGCRRLWRNALAARSLVREEDFEMDSKLHLSTAIGFRSTRPETELFDMSEVRDVKEGSVSTLLGGMETQGWLWLKVS